MTWSWTTAGARHVVVVNLGSEPAQGLVKLPWDDLAGQHWVLTDRLTGERFERAGDALAEDGLYVALSGWASHFLTFAPARRLAMSR